MNILRPLLALFVIALLAACGSMTGTTDEAPEAVAAPTKLVIYSGRSESLVGPLIKQMREDLGLDIEVQYGKTPELTTRLLLEGAESPADLIFAQDSGHLGVMADKDVLAPLPAELFEGIDPRFKDPAGRWVGTSGRLRVLVYNSDKLKPEDLPASLKDLADPKWKGRFGWAPTNGSYQVHIAALRALWGADETRAWLEKVKANEPGGYPKNSPIVAAVNSGEAEIGWVNHYYLHRLDKEGRKAVNASFSAAEDAGNILMVSGIGIRKGSPNEEAAQRVVAWLTAEKAQGYFANETFEYPDPRGHRHPRRRSAPERRVAGARQAG